MPKPRTVIVTLELDTNVALTYLRSKRFWQFDTVNLTGLGSSHMKSNKCAMTVKQVTVSVAQPSKRR